MELTINRLQDRRKCQMHMFGLFRVPRVELGSVLKSV